MLITAAGTEFRNYLDAWQSTCIAEDKKNQIEMLLDGQNFILFFEYEGDVFGTGEQHRVTFARMKSPDEDEADGSWLKDASFMAFNLTTAIKGQPQQHIFYHKDLDKIHVLSKEETLEALLSQSQEAPPEHVAAGAKAIVRLAKTISPEKPAQNDGV